MVYNRFLRFTYIIIIITLCFGISLSAQDITEKNSVVILPFGGENVPTYIPMIVEKLFASKIEKTEAYFIFDREIFDKILDNNNITLPEKITNEIAHEIGQKLEIDHILFGEIIQENDDFVIRTIVMDSETGSIVSDNTERASSIKGLETAVAQLTRKIVKTVLPEEAVAEAVQAFDDAEETEKEEKVIESITAFEKIVEEDPEKALELIAEPVREALKETVREEIVEKEIQFLFDREKADKKRVWQFWSIVGLESSVQIGNIIGLVSLNQRLDSVLYWNNYMNNIFQDDPYRSYKDNLESSQTFQGWNYFLTSGANFGLAYYYSTIPDDIFSFSILGRKTLAISNILNISGYLAQTASSQLGFYAQRTYFDYMNATTGFTEKYHVYRDAYLWPLIAEYSRLGLWAVGLTGIVTAAILPGEKTPMILTEKSRGYLVLGQNLLSIGNLTAGMATNFRGIAEEAWISDNSPSGSIGDSNYDFNYIMSEVLYYSTYAIYIGAAFYTYMGLTYNGSGNEEVSDSTVDTLFFSIVPVPGGITAFARMRFD